MAGAGPGGISQDDIQMVQNLIERCLQLYMTQVRLAVLMLFLGTEPQLAFAADVFRADHACCCCGGGGHRCCRRHRCCCCR